jgi:hypothetical protein
MTMRTKEEEEEEEEEEKEESSVCRLTNLTSSKGVWKGEC